jgi:hypothetical protein
LSTVEVAFADLKQLVGDGIISGNDCNNKGSKD